MRAVVSDEGLPIDDPAALRDADLPEPEPGPRDVLIRVEAVSVNPVDVKKRRSHRSGRGPLVLGYDGAGVVVGLGSEVDDLAEGDEVWWSGDATRPGANAQLQAVDHRIVALKPTSATFADAASLPLTALTAWESMFDHLRLDAQEDGTMLIVGGAGGVGSILTQLAKRLTALRVIATASRDESQAWARRMGADAVVEHDDLEAAVRAVEPEAIDYVFSSYTPGNIGAYAKLLRPFGHVVSIDGTDESLLPLFAKSVSMHWEYMFARSRYGAHDVSEQSRALAAVAQLVDAGDVVTTATRYIDDFSAEGIREAHRLVESQAMIGKVVIHR